MNNQFWTIIYRQERRERGRQILLLTDHHHLSIYPRDIRWCEWMNVRVCVYICICTFYVSLVVLDLDHGIGGKRRKQSVQSSKLKLLSTPNRTSFARFELERTSTFTHLSSSNNDKVSFIKVNWPSSHTSSRTPRYTHCVLNKWIVDLVNMTSSCEISSIDLIRDQMMDQFASVICLLLHAFAFIYWLDMHAYRACQKVKKVCRE